MTNEPTIKDIWEVVSFIKNNGATQDDIAGINSRMTTKDDINELRTELKNDIENIHTDIYDTHSTMATKKDINELRNEIVEHVDYLVKFDNEQKSQISSISLRQDRTEKKLDLVIEKNNLKSV
ncbi:MAG: hypothetical protein GF349_00740 [Candidatus Magasanikbacteria bacterium]|nr:hypothetical protein [Candidatus Magasanikbacteria bacterium]